MAEEINENDCLFCNIVKGNIPAKKVFENERVLAFLDIFPVAKGHTVIIPKKHYYNLLDFPEEEMNFFFKTLKEIAALLKNKLNADGFNVIQNNYPAAGQVVPHFHYHIIPRWKDDKVMNLKQPKTQATDEELEKTLKMIKK